MEKFLDFIGSFFAGLMRVVHLIEQFQQQGQPMLVAAPPRADVVVDRTGHWSVLDDGWDADYTPDGSEGGLPVYREAPYNTSEWRKNLPPLPGDEYSAEADIEFIREAIARLRAHGVEVEGGFGPWIERL